MTTPTVFVIGDSISIQYGPYLEQFLRGKAAYGRKKGLEDAMKNLDIPGGANGGDSSRVLAYMAGNETHKEIPFCDFLLVNCGLHDIKTDPKTGQKQIPVDRYEENLCGIVALSRKMCRHFVWIHTTPCDETIHNTPGMQFHRYHRDNRAYIEVASKVMQMNEIPVIDLHAFTLNLGADPYCDHVHFREAIREKQAAFIAGWLCHAIV